MSDVLLGFGITAKFTAGDGPLPTLNYKKPNPLPRLSHLRLLSSL